MATILTKRSNTASSVPVAGDLTNSTGGAELAVNTADKRLFTKDSGGTVVELGTNPSSVTLPNGTANGVPYLNGSKVLTSGSALTFDGTSLGLGGFGAISSGRAVGVYDNTTARLVLRNATTGNTATDGFEIAATGSNVFISNKESGYIAFENAGSEQMRLTSTGLGIGTSSPVGNLVVSTGAVGSANSNFRQIVAEGTGNSGITILSGSTSIGALNFGDSAANQAGSIRYDHNVDNLLLNVGSSTAVTINSSGNLGLGVTPSAWGTFSGVLEFAGGANIEGFSTGLLGMGSNHFFNGTNFIYKISSFASRYIMDNTGGFKWYTAPSGTAGNAISFTQAMTLDASGNLGIGTTSPGTKLDVRAGSVIQTIYNTDATGNDTHSAIIRAYAASTSYWNKLILDGSGIVFNAYGTERARIDSSGNLLVGTTSTSPSTGGFAIKYNGGVSFIDTSHSSGTGSGQYYAAYTYAGTVVGTITQNGTTGVLYNLTSDYRLKNNAVALTGAKSFVMALQPKTWDWWDGSGKGVGFIAHEFMEVAKYSGNGEKDAVDADGKPVYQSIQPSSSEVMANLVALIQEQQNTIDQLKARLDAANL